jgi:hypothetical protein
VPCYARLTSTALWWVAPTPVARGYGGPQPPCYVCSAAGRTTSPVDGTRAFDARWRPRLAASEGPRPCRTALAVAGPPAWRLAAEERRSEGVPPGAGEQRREGRNASWSRRAESPSRGSRERRRRWCSFGLRERSGIARGRSRSLII